MKALKNISDELWLGIMFILASVWLVAFNHAYLLISGVFIFLGIFLIIIDSLNKNKKDENSKNDLKV